MKAQPSVYVDGTYAPLSDPATGTGATAPERWTAPRARHYLRATGAAVGTALLLTALTYDAAAGVNVVLVACSFVALALAKRSGYVLKRLGGREARGLFAQLLAFGALCAASVWHFNPWTVVPLILATLVLTASLLEPRHHPATALLASLTRVLLALLTSVIHWAKASRAARYFAHEARIPVARLVVPLAATALFGALYVVSNAALADGWMAFSDWFGVYFDFGTLLAVLITAVLWGTLTTSVALPLNRRLPGGRFRGLRRAFAERPAATASASWSTVSVTLVCVNALALALNVTDGLTTWVPEAVANGAELKRGVHAGTYALVTAIVLAAGYLLWQFRGRLPDHERAQALALGWLAQNAVMAFTVALRNYHYTDAYGLTIKRIGVWVFLLCCASGLYFLGEKLRRGSSVAQLVRRQSWAAYAFLAVAALPNWPEHIVHYNFSAAREHLDRDYLQRLAPHTYPAWGGYEPDVVAHRMRFHSRTAHHFDPAHAPSSDWRAWHYQRARLQALALDFRQNLPQ